MSQSLRSTVTKPSMWSPWGRTLGACPIRKLPAFKKYDSSRPRHPPTFTSLKYSLRLARANDSYTLVGTITGTTKTPSILYSDSWLNGASAFYGADANATTGYMVLDGGHDYTIYVEASNSAGSSPPSNSIVVTVPYTPPAATLSAAVIASGTNFVLSITGTNFGNSETVDITVVWSVVGWQQPVSYPFLGTTNFLGGFTEQFSGPTPEGLCPILVPFGNSQQPQQTFQITATGQTSHKTASATAGPFTCPYNEATAAT